MRQLRLSKALLLLAVLLPVFVWTTVAASQNPGGNPEAAKVKNPVASTSESIAKGTELFSKNCRFCHGADAKGNGPMAPEGTHPSDLTDAKWDRGSTDGEIFAVIQNGAGPKFDMKGYKGKMADTDIWNVVNYLRSIGPK
jgi:mono/diheme cytochrome c family protein